MVAAACHYSLTPASRFPSFMLLRSLYIASCKSVKMRGENWLNLLGRILLRPYKFRDGIDDCLGAKNEIDLFFCKARSREGLDSFQSLIIAMKISMNYVVR